jgi:hypothetical protein
MSEADQTQALLEGFQAHEAEARAVPESARRSPVLAIGDYVKETQGIVAYAQSVWDKGPDGAPPLKVGRSKCSLERLVRLVSLLRGLQYVYALELTEAHPIADIGPKAKRAQFIIDELDDSLSFVLDDDVHEPADDRLAAAKEATEATDTRGASVGQLLLAWGLFAKDEIARLTTLDDFDPAMIDEAISLGTLLMQAKSLNPARRQELRNLRLGFYTLVYADIQALRAAANYAYRRHPDLRQKFTSALERNRRNQKRLEKKLAEISASSEAPSTETPSTETPSA